MAIHSRSNGTRHVQTRQILVSEEKFQRMTFPLTRGNLVMFEQNLSCSNECYIVRTNFSPFERNAYFPIFFKLLIIYLLFSIFLEFLFILSITIMILGVPFSSAVRFGNQGRSFLGRRVPCSTSATLLILNIANASQGDGRGSFPRSKLEFDHIHNSNLK